MLSQALPSQGQDEIEEEVDEALTPTSPLFRSIGHAEAHPRLLGSPSKTVDLGATSLRPPIEGGVPIKWQGSLLAGSTDCPTRDLGGSGASEGWSTGDFEFGSSIGHQSECGFTWRQGQMIGSGAYGRVYMGLVPEDGRLVAIKQLEYMEAVPEDEEKVNSLDIEISLLRRLRHEHIVGYLGTSRAVAGEMKVRRRQPPKTLTRTLTPTLGVPDLRCSTSYWSTSRGGPSRA